MYQIQPRSLGQVARDAYLQSLGLMAMSAPDPWWEQVSIETRGRSGGEMYRSFQRLYRGDAPIWGSPTKFESLDQDITRAWEFAALAVRTSIERPQSDAILQEVLSMIPQQKQSLWSRILAAFRRRK